MIEPIYAEIGARILAARKSAHLGQQDVAEILGVSVPLVSQIESGRIRFSLDTICEIAAIVNSSAGELLGLKCRKRQNRQMRTRNGRGRAR